MESEYLKGGEGLSGDGARSQDDDEDGDDEQEEEEEEYDEDEDKSGEILELLLKCTNNTIKADVCFNKAFLKYGNILRFLYFLFFIFS